MRKWLPALLSRSPSRRANRALRRRALTLEQLEDRIALAGNILATVAGPYPQYQFQEYTPDGSQVRAVNIPATPGSSFDYARSLVEDPNGTVYVYNGTFTPYLATYNPATSSWSQTTYTGWSTVSNVSYGGLAQFGNYLYASDMATAGAGAPNGVVRFNLADGSATRFGNVDFTQLSAGLDGKLYALSAATSTVYVYDPISTALLNTVALPSADYRGVVANGNGDLYTVAWNNVISHFNSSGVLQNSITLNSSTGAPFMYNNSDDIAIAPDGTLAIGSFSGYIARMTSAFTNVSYINTNSNNQVFVTFAPQPAQPSISVSDTTVTSPLSGLAQAAFVASLSAPSSSPVTVSFTTADGTAAAGPDYQAASGTLTFAPGQTSQTVYINVQADPYWDPAETFSLNLSNPTGATLAKGQGTATINSSLPTPTISVNNVTVTNVASGTTQATLVVSLSEPLSDPQTFGYSTADVTARAGSDYVATSGYVNFLPGQTNQTVTVNVIGDPYYDGPEIFDLNLLPPGGSSPFATGVATIFSGVPMPAASVNDVTVQNTASGAAATFTVSLSAPSEETTTVGYSTYGGYYQTSSNDFQSTSGTLTFAPGQTSQTVNVNVVGDPYYDGTEQFWLNLLSPTNATIARGQGTATILSTLPGPPTLSVSSPTVTNVTSGLTQATFTVSLSEPLSDPVSIQYGTTDGTAAAGTDYQSAAGYVNFSPGQTTQTVSVNVIGDPTYDSPETFYLNLMPVSAGGGGAPYATGTCTINSALAQPGLSVGSATVTDGTSGTTPLTFTVSLTAASADPVTVNYGTADGTAVAGTDYQTASGTLTFAPGQTSQTIVVNAIGNPLYAPTKTFTVNLSSPSGAGLAQGQGTGTIVSSLTQPAVSIGGVYVTDVDSGTTPARFWVWLSSGSSLPVTVDYTTVDGTAVAGTDYVAASGTLTFAPGQTGQYISVDVLGTANYAPGRTFSVVLSNPQNAGIGNQGGTGHIYDDAPIANIGPNTTARVGSPVQFDASGSRDLDGDPLTYTWDFGDGATGSGLQPTHVYAAVGAYTATVSVSDGSAVTTASETVTINAAPALGTLSTTQWTAGQTGYTGAIPTSGVTGTLTVTSQANMPPGLSATVVGTLVTFTGTPTTAGTYSNIQLTVQDSTGATSTGTYSITINPVPTLGALSATAWTANQPGFSGTVAVLGGTAPIGNLNATGLPPGLFAAQSGNTITISGTPTTAGTYNNIRLSVQDYALATASGTFSIIVHAPGPAVTLGLTNYPTALTAGASGSFTVTALDASGYVATSYRGTVYLGSTDPLAGYPPATYTFTAADSGVHTFSFTLDTAGSQQLYAKDAYGVNGFSGPITVSPATLNHFAVAAPTYSGSYYGFNVTVSAKDAYNNTIPGYNGTVHFTSSDGAATLPADYTYTSTDQGSHTFTATLQTTGTQTIAVNDTNNTAATGTASVQDLDAVPGLHFVVNPSVTTTTAGAAFDVTVTALDQYNNVAVHYDGTASFSSSDRGSAVVLPANYTFTAADAGVHTFAGGVTLVTAGNQSLSVVDTATVVVAGGGSSSASVAVTPAPVSALVISGLPVTATRGAAQAFTVTSKDAYGNTATGYSGTVHFTSSDPLAVLPPDTALNAGTGTFQVVFGSLGTQSLFVADTYNSALMATQGGIAVNPAPAAHLVVTGFPSSSTAGLTGTFSVAAIDAYGYVATDYNGTVHFTSSDPLAVLPANVTLANGTGSFSATLKTAGVESLTATDTTNASVNGTQGNISLAPAAARTLVVAGMPTSITAGVSGTAMVTARDAYGNVATGYTGTVHFTSTDPQAVLPADYTFIAADAGSHAFAIIFKTAATQLLTVADTTGTLSNGSQSGIAVNAAAVARLTGSGPANNIPNSGYPFFVWAVDAYGNQVRNFADTVHFTSSDPLAVLPADYTYTSADVGSHNFLATLKAVGNQTITVTDTGTPGVGAMQFNVSVQVGAATGLSLTGFLNPTTAGVAGTFIVRAYDLYGNTATGYTGTVHFTSGDLAGLLPADYTFTAADAGVHTFSATLITAGGQGLWVQDAQNNFTAAQYAINVAPAAASRLVATSYYAFTTAGAVDNVTIAAEDPYGNVAAGYRGDVHFSSSDPQASLPADYTFTAADAGVHTFAVILKTAGSQTVSWQDAQAGFSSTLGTSVSAAAASQLVISGFPSPTTAGFTNSFTVRATDLYGNTATGYTGTVHFMSTDLAAQLPANYTFTAADAGTHTFSARLITAGGQALWVQDAPNNLTGAGYAISVAPAAPSRLIAAYAISNTAGAIETIAVTAQDPYGNVATTYTGTVHVSSSDPQAGLPADYTFTAADAGTHLFSVVLKTAGAQTVTFQDATHSFSTTANVSVTAAAASRFVLSGFPSATTAGVLQNVTLTALDAYGNIATGYTGTVHLTSSDLQAVLPADYTFSNSDNGVHTFSVGLCTAGTQSLTVTDTATATLTASQTGISVVAGAVSKFTISGYPATTAGQSHNFTVTATDAYGNVVTGYRGTVHFSSSDTKAGLPGNYTFAAGDKGVHTFSATLKTAGNQSLTATDTTTGLTGSQSGIVVTAAAATHFSITAPTAATIGVAVTITVTALDAYGNIATGYLGTIHFTSSDSKAILPSNYTFVAADDGVHTFTVTFESSGTQTLTGTDTHTGSIKGSASVKAS
jgi:hypothetical protein